MAAALNVAIGYPFNFYFSLVLKEQEELMAVLELAKYILRDEIVH